MRNIQIEVLNSGAVAEAEKMMVCVARLTQSGQKIKTLDDFLALYNAPYSEKTIKRMADLPHPTIQKFGAINIVVVGASRRFLAQITRHQNEVKFMSASLQYSDYSNDADFVIPYTFIEQYKEQQYLDTCQKAMAAYQQAIKTGIDNDAAGYMAPQGLRNVLVISATPYQWKHMISQRTCRRNTEETRYVMLRIWQELKKLSPALFANCGPFCFAGKCQEGMMSCGKPRPGVGPEDLIKADFPLLVEGGKNNED